MLKAPLRSNPVITEPKRTITESQREVRAGNSRYWCPGSTSPVPTRPPPASSLPPASAGPEPSIGVPDRSDPDPWSSPFEPTGRRDRQQQQSLHDNSQQAPEHFLLPGDVHVAQWLFRGDVIKQNKLKLNKLKKNKIHLHCFFSRTRCCLGQGEIFILLIREHHLWNRNKIN